MRATRSSWFQGAFAGLGVQKKIYSIIQHVLCLGLDVVHGTGVPRASKLVSESVQSGEKT